jgi:hypothetical protein
VYEILSEIKDIKYNKVPWNETVIKLIFCKKNGGEGAKTRIIFLTNEQLSCTFNADIVIIYLNLEKNMIFWGKIVIFYTKYPKNVRPSLRSAQFFKCAPLIWNPGSAPVAVSFICRGNWSTWRKRQTCCKSLTNSIT